MMYSVNSISIRILLASSLSCLLFNQKRGIMR
jgi:hypothetical protein